MTSYVDLPCRDDDGNLLVVVEAPRGSLVKIKYSPKLKVFQFGRALTLGVAYPYDWGFVPSTEAEDGDPLDAMVLFDCPTWPGIVIPAVEIGIVTMTQKDGDKRVHNDRVIAVPMDDKHFETIDDLSKRTRTELEQFFKTVSLMTKKEVHIESWEGPKVARDAIKAAAHAYSKGKR